MPDLGILYLSGRMPPSCVPFLERALCLVAVGDPLPWPSHLVLPVQRFRSAILRRACGILRPDLDHPDWSELGLDALERLSGLSGKHPDGTPLQNSSHLALLPLYGADHEPDRLYAWKEGGLDDWEIQAIHEACLHPIRWDWDRALRLAPFGRLPLPESWSAPSRLWRTITPFVPVGSRFRFRTDGSVKKSETPEKQVGVLCDRLGLPRPQIEVDDAGPLHIHQPMAVRQRLGIGAKSNLWPGYHLFLRFPEPVAGPLFLGHSSHFGLGLLEAVPEE